MPYQCRSDAISGRDPATSREPLTKKTCLFLDQSWSILKTIVHGGSEHRVQCEPRKLGPENMRLAKYRHVLGAPFGREPLKYSMSKESMYRCIKATLQVLKWLELATEHPDTSISHVDASLARARISYMASVT